MLVKVDANFTLSKPSTNAAFVNTSVLHSIHLNSYFEPTVNMLADSYVLLKVLFSLP